MIAAETTVVNPAAGPDTARGALLIIETTIPPIIPPRIPEYNGAPHARAIPRQRGMAIRNTAMPAGRSCLSHNRR